jgi:murein DD-endopeptidase MepM/ murein hydrolase activator NlpD
MRRFLAVALVALAAAGAASAQPSPDSVTANPSTVLLPQLLAAPVAPQQLSFADLQPVWQAAGSAYGVPWSVLAAINKVESNFGQNMGPSSAGAIGWMQFMPDTWAQWGVDANGDGVADPWNAQDAIYSAARYLAATGGTTDIASAVFAYNHAQWYVDEVMRLAQQYANGGADFSAALDGAQEQIDTAKQAVLDASAQVLDANTLVASLQDKENALLARADATELFTNRLSAQKLATLVAIQLQSAQADAAARTAELQSAQETLAAARNNTSGATFAAGTGSLLGAPSYSNGYVFPVAGGAGVVSVGHTHHDYPAADIAAPEGTQLYALSDGTVERSWAEPSGNCGIGFTIATTDGLTWTYCHMAYLEPAVVEGAQLSAGQPVGLVGHTGDADGPHLHLQLEPASAYPQDEAWFQAFAGTAFTWSDSVQSNAASAPVFAVVGGSADPASNPAPDPAPRSLDSASAPVIFFTATGA